MLGISHHMRILLSQLIAVSKHRASGYLENVLSKGTVEGIYLSIPAESYYALKDKYNYTVLPQSGSSAMPPLRQQIKNAAGAAGRVVKAVAKGQPVVADEALINERKKICEGCNHLQRGRCSLCGCNFSMKIRLNTERCPISKW